LKSQNHFVRLFIERLELNARKVRAGWDAIGDELGQTIESFLKQYDSIELAEESK
jgi:N6-adenosine-specific RNA methylase IME4